MKKRFASLLMATLLVAGMVGCSSSTSTTDSSSTDAGSTYPNGPVSVIVPFSAGGGTDLVTRAIVDAAKDDFPSNISVENRTGGGGAVGMVYGANAKDDGSVLTTITVELVTLPHTGTGGNLTPDQFKPVMMMNSVYSVITVKADSPYNDLADFITAAETKDLQIGNSGVGAIWHLSAAALAQESGVEFVHVPFEGAAPAVTSLLGGHIDAVSVSYPEVAAQVQAGELKVISVLAPERLEELPDVPTAIEEGYDVAIGTWRGIGVPASTSDETVEQIYEILNKASQDPAFVSFMESNSLTIDILNPTEYQERINNDYEMFGTLIKDLGLDQQ